MRADTKQNSLCQMEALRFCLIAALENAKATQPEREIPPSGVPSDSQGSLGDLPILETAHFDSSRLSGEFCFASGERTLDFRAKS